MSNQFNLRKCALPAAIGAIVGAAHFPALAQTPVLEEVLVTAQKREQSSQEVPVAMSVLNAGALENMDVKTFEDVARVSPALTIETGAEPSENTIRMRGVGTSAYSIAAEPSVSVVVDGVPLLVTAQAFGNLEDIERIEVLKGPQGTLFGKNASAGVVNITTKAPTDELTGRLGFRATDDGEIKGNASFSGPISDTLGFRLNAYAIDREGYMTNLYNDTDLGGEKSHGVRGKLAWTPTYDLDVNLILDTAYRDASGASPFIALPAGEPGREMITAGPDNLDVQLDTQNRYETQNDLGVIKLDYNLGNHTLTSISSYQRFTQNDLQDTDNSSEPIEQNPFLNPTGAPPGTPNIEARSSRESTAFSQEVRLATNTPGQFEYMVGAWYQDVEHDRTYDRCCFRFLLADWDAIATTESMALFGQGSWNFAQDTFLDVGLRLNREDISVDFTNHLSDPADNFVGSDSETASTGKIALRHFLENGAMVYGAVSTGYKGQAYDVSSSFSAADAAEPVGSETSTSYEVGMKGRSPGGSFRYDLVAFLTNFNDYQAQGAVVQEEGNVEFSLNNVGELQTQGLEADLSWQATDDLRLDFVVSLTDATIKSFPFADCYFGQTEEEGCNVVLTRDEDGEPDVVVQDLAGKDLNNSPDIKFNFAAYWERNLGSSSFNWFAQGNYQWQDDVNYDLFGAPSNKQDAFGLANFSAGITHPDGNYRVSLFVQNAFDQRYYTRVDDTSNRRDDGQLQIAVQRPRESMRYVGLKVDFMLF
ncbi:TonB-dependent receptor [Marinimicrobium alkaliphilum]|uniref:TonB-dependent receptor n=1 Tax=Marinimicrobium alkaliphilum TaxID=2202654 RepID=UPI000DB930C8|nr:TonB-dependent receptor [Marinimicrobium alkaliphilum]